MKYTETVSEVGYSEDYSNSVTAWM